MINEGNTFEVANLYDNSWPKLSDDYFKTSSWPEAHESTVLCTRLKINYHLEQWSNF